MTKFEMDEFDLDSNVIKIGLNLNYSGWLEFWSLQKRNFEFL